MLEKKSMRTGSALIAKDFLAESLPKFVTSLSLDTVRFSAEADADAEESFTVLAISETRFKSDLEPVFMRDIRIQFIKQKTIPHVSSRSWTCSSFRAW